MKDPRKDTLCRERYAELLPNLADYVAKWAKEKPGALALIEHNTGDRVTWKTFNTSVDAFAAKLLSIGLRKGDVVATSLPLLKEHAYLMYACYKIGVVFAPLDLRLKAREIAYCIEKIQPKAYFFVGVPQITPVIKEVIGSSPSVKTWVQFQKDDKDIIPGAIWIKDFIKDIKVQFIKSKLFGTVNRARKAVTKRDACLIIFTTGSTGSPKPALLCHENIMIQNVGLAVGFELKASDRMLVNLPPSHVGCVTEQLCTTIYGGGTAVILHIFDAKLSLKAIQEHKVTTLGQIPALFNMEWRLSDYKSYDLASLRFAIYGGQAVSKPFLAKMKEMAPQIGTGLGLTETAGFCTYTDVTAGVDDLVKGIGFDQPLCPISIREPMNADGTAGREKAKNEVGEVCFSGPQIFLGYMGDEANTRKTVSREGVCYTGDLGFYDADGLHFAGRSKFVIKPKGYQVSPEEIEKAIGKSLAGRASMVAAVGAEHEIYSEAVMLYVECAEGQVVTEEEVKKAAQELASYSRPSYIEILKTGQMPLNRVAKTDYLILREKAKATVAKLRAEGKWDK
ncbi:MAG: class I adenylate-forming enzyme family protein [Myxococcota bacterium]|jgi:acyl-CoA synthetase (AMP-forming)/AMP-acid ligase II